MILKLGQVFQCPDKQLFTLTTGSRWVELSKSEQDVTTMVFLQEHMHNKVNYTKSRFLFQSPE